MRNTQGFFNIDQALIRLKNSTSFGSIIKNTNEIRTEVEILKKYVDYTDQLVDKLKRRNMLITDLRRHLEEAERHIRDLKNSEPFEIYPKDEVA